MKERRSKINKLNEGRKTFNKMKQECAEKLREEQEEKKEWKIQRERKEGI